MKQKIYLFDIDGTLTLPRQKISDDFETFFNTWIMGKQVFLVTGSDLKKVKEQLTERILKNVSGIFCCMANELYINEKLEYSNKLDLPIELFEFLKEQVKNSKFPIKLNNNFEFRTGMLNFSIPGRESNLELRQKYFEWDNENKERLKIVNYINKNFGDTIEARIGGQISIDIQNIGNNKSLSTKWIREKFEKENIDIIFFGDKTDVGGNDYDAAKDVLGYDGGKVIKVTDPNDLKNKLEFLWEFLILIF